jgi:hypothetical protein
MSRAVITPTYKLDADTAGPDAPDFAPLHCAISSCPIAGIVPGIWHWWAHSEGRSSVKPLAVNDWPSCEAWRRTCASLGRHRENEMLRITVQEDGTLWRLHLSGRLADAWVAETENTWRSAPVSGRRFEVDLSDVTGIDEAGRRLLRAMNQAGACFFAKGVAMEALVEEITGASAPERRRR